jgi:hypothetical protein
MRCNLTRRSSARIVLIAQNLLVELELVGGYVLGSVIELTYP